MLNQIPRATMTLCVLASLAAAPAFAQQSRSDTNRDAQDQQADSRDQGSEQQSRQQRDADRDVYDSNQQRQQTRYQAQQRYQDESRQDRFRDAAGEQADRYSEDTRRRGSTPATRSSDDQPAGLGVTVTQDQQQRLQIRQVFPDSPADEAGLRTGDQIVEVDGQRITSPEQFVEAIREKDPDSRVELRINRNGSPRTVTAQLASRREALDIQRQGQSGQMQFPGGRDLNAPSSSDLADHIQMLEQQIRRLTAEISDLRQMLSDDPDASQSTGRSTTQSRTQSRSRSNYGDQSDSRYDDQSGSRDNDRFNSRDRTRSSNQSGSPYGDR